MGTLGHVIGHSRNIFKPNTDIYPKKLKIGPLCVRLRKECVDEVRGETEGERVEKIDVTGECTPTILEIKMEANRCGRCGCVLFPEENCCFFCGEGSEREEFCFPHEASEVSVERLEVEVRGDSVGGNSVQAHLEHVFPCEIPAPFNPVVGKKAGTLFFHGYFHGSIKSPEEFNAFNSVMAGISDALANLLGVLPHLAKGSAIASFTSYEKIPL